MLTPQYAAGFFDGEGTVRIDKRGRDKSRYLRTSISNTNQDVLRLFEAQFGGFVSTPRKKRPTWKPSGEWIVSGKDAAAFLEFIQPYAIVKRGQIALGLEFWTFQRKPTHERCDFIHGKGMHTHIKRKPEVEDKEREYEEAMSRLNKKGSQDQPSVHEGVH